MSYQIRTASVADLAGIVALARSCFEFDPVSPARIEEKLFSLRPPGMSRWETFVAVDGAQILGILQHAVRPAAEKAWIGLLGVVPALRGRGIATALLAHARSRWSAEIKIAEALAIPGNYFTPGIDPRYTSGLVWLTRRGFSRSGDCCNLLAPLQQEFETAQVDSHMAESGIEIRRADQRDTERFARFFAAIFGEDWRFEVACAMDHDPPGVHLALKEDEILGFAAHSGQNRELGFFGPMGTLPAARGTGIGRVLLWRCLNDLRNAGHRHAVIPWVGPIDFYHRWAGCTVERVFWRLKLECRVEEASDGASSRRIA